MRKKTLQLLPVLSTATPLLAQSAAGWTTFSPPGGGCSILVPGTPETLPVEPDTLNGKDVVNHLFRVRTSMLTYLLVGTEYNQIVNVEGKLDASRNNFVKAVSGTRWYGETVVMPNGVDDTRAAARFLYSFQLTGAK